MHANVIKSNNNIYILNFFVFSIVFKLLHNVLYLCIYIYFFTHHLHLVQALTRLYICPHYIRCIFRLSLFFSVSKFVHATKQYYRNIICIPCYFQFALDVIWLRILFLKDFNYTLPYLRIIPCCQGDH